MNWKVKNKVFHIIERITMGDRIYYCFQKRITKSVWVADSGFMGYYKSKVKNHLDIIGKYGDGRTDDKMFFEFGAGWDMLCPIGIALCGVKKYYAVDINRYAHPELIKNTADLYIKNSHLIQANYAESGLQERYERVAELSSCVKKDVLSVLNDELNIYYYAPLDASNTPFESESVDYVISNVSLEHIPYDTIDCIFAECYRLLKVGGVMSLTVDYTDHWSHCDDSINQYNYMQYSDKEWVKYNPAMHYQNRLQHSDYINLLLKNKFTILETIPSSISEDDEEQFDMTSKSNQFDKYSRNDLLLKNEHFVAVKKK